MYLLRLFHQSDPTRQVESRQLDQGELVIGRDPGFGWKIDDPDRQISRAHCTLMVKGGDVAVRDTSSNGVFFGGTGKRLPANHFVPLPLGESLQLGYFIITVELAKSDAIFDPPPPPIHAGRPDTSASPFEPPPGVDGLQGLGRPMSPDPFASELKPSALEAEAFVGDPFSFDRAANSGRKPLSAIDEDAWQRREESRVGDWNGPSAHRAVSHEALIGSDREWSEPPSSGPAEVGFGFDAPFHRPMLKAAPIPPEALLIPTDWDLSPAESVTPAAPGEAAAPSLVEEIVTSEPVAPTSAPEPELETPVSPPEPEPQLVAAPSKPVKAPEPQPEPLLVSRSAKTGADEPSRVTALAAEALLNAFCEGANLDPADFAGEDPAAVLHRAGAIYQQMVLGLSDLLGERTSLKNEYRMARTSVAPEGNNPFKWAPARRVAVDLLRGANDGFMSGPPAVRESFADLKKHLLCLLAGMRASLSSTLNALSPKAVESRIKGQTFVIKQSRGAAAWSEYGRVYAEFQQQADDNPDSQINRDFRSAYEQQLGELDGLNASR